MLVQVGKYHKMPVELSVPLSLIWYVPHILTSVEVLITIYFLNSFPLETKYWVTEVILGGWCGVGKHFEKEEENRTANRWKWKIIYLICPRHMLIRGCSPWTPLDISASPTIIRHLLALIAPLFHIYSFIFRHSTEQQKRSNSISRRRRAISVRYLFQILLGLILIALHIIIIQLLRRPTIHGRFISSAKLENYKTQTTVKYDNSLRKNSTFFLC